MIRIEINNVDKSSLINWQSVSVSQNLTSQIDTAQFQYRKTNNKDLVPQSNDDVKIYDGDECIFGGRIVKVDSKADIAEGELYNINCSDYSYEFNGILVAKSYEDMSGKEIIDALFTEFAPDFNTDNVICDYPITRIVFNQIKLSECLERLSKIADYEWYVSPDKKIYFFQRFSNDAPFNLTDTNGNYIYKTLQSTIDSSLIANQVKVRGGMGVETSIFTDGITVIGDETKTFKLPYKFQNLSILLNDIEQDVGIDNINDFTDYDVLYNYQMDTIRFENSLNDADIITFSGNKKFPVMAIASDDDSISMFGLREKLVRDSTIEDTITARQRAMIELDTYKNNISSCQFDTRTNGLRTGMRISITSNIRNLSEFDFIIDKITFKTDSPSSFKYSVSCSTARKYGMVEFLRALFRGTTPDHFKEDEKEVAEIIKTDNQKINIIEEIEAVSPKLDEQSVEITEQIDQFDFEPTWVLANYIPTSPDDTKRNGLLDRTMKLY